MLVVGAVALKIQEELRVRVAWVAVEMVQIVF
jgi:hypothetical protein